MASKLNTFYGTKRGKTAYEERIAREKEAQRRRDIAAEKAAKKAAKEGA